MFGHEHFNGKEQMQLIPAVMCPDHMGKILKIHGNTLIAFDSLLSQQEHA